MEAGFLEDALNAVQEGAVLWPSEAAASDVAAADGISPVDITALGQFLSLFVAFLSFFFLSLSFFLSFFLSLSLFLSFFPN